MSETAIGLAAGPTPTVSIAHENRWLSSTFGLPSVIASEDFYTVAKQQYGRARYNLAIRCLEIYVSRLASIQAAAATTAQAVSATQAASSGRTGHGPAGKGGSSGLGKEGPSRSALPIGPLHLLAFAHYNLGGLSKARECFLACVRLGFDADWQMLVQVELELADAIKIATEREEIAGQQAIATLRKHLQANARWNQKNGTAAATTATTTTTNTTTTATTTAGEGAASSAEAESDSTDDSMLPTSSLDAIEREEKQLAVAAAAEAEAESAAAAARIGSFEPITSVTPTFSVASDEALLQQLATVTPMSSQPPDSPSSR